MQRSIKLVPITIFISITIIISLVTVKPQLNNRDSSQAKIHIIIIIVSNLISTLSVCDLSLKYNVVTRYYINN